MKHNIDAHSHTLVVDDGNSSDSSIEENNDLVVSDELKKQWEIEQNALKKCWSPHNCQAVHLLVGSRPDDWSLVDYYVAGVDISFIKGDNVNACAALVVVRLRDSKVVYTDCEMVQLTAPYIPGFLAFREVPFLVKLFDKLKATQPELYPHVTMVDGNGYLHVREFGLACHLGVLLNMATIGVAKNLFHVDGIGKDERHRERICELEDSGDKFALMGESGKTYGYALRSCDATTNPVYVSVGHLIDLDTAVDLVHRFCVYRVPEPVRQADQISREYLRVHYPT